MLQQISKIWMKLKTGHCNYDTLSMLKLKFWVQKSIFIYILFCDNIIINYKILKTPFDDFYNREFFY